MKVIIAGSRTFKNDELLWKVMKEFKDVSEVLCGGARGADERGQLWAYEHGIPVKMFIPDWDRFGKAAGMKRNIQMAEYADALIAFWDGESPGTKNMIAEATKRGLNVTVIKYFIKTEDW